MTSGMKKRRWESSEPAHQINIQAFWLKYAQYESCEFKFYSGTLLRTVAWEIASQQFEEKPVYIYAFWGLGNTCGQANIFVKDFC